MADDSETCCTVETPSRLMLFYPDSAPSALTAFLPTQPVCKPVGQRVTLGRSSSADIRLNDERMSRLYAALWHDGKDPFVFRVSNLSERKLLLVDGAMLRYNEEAEVKDGCVLTLDFLQIKAKVCAGDYVAFTYQISFVKNVVITPPISQKPPEGKCLMPPRSRDLSSGFSCNGQQSFENAGDVVSKLLTCLRTGSLDAGISSDMSFNSSAPYITERSHSDPYDVGVEYELPENIGASPLGVFGSTELAPGGLSKVSMSNPLHNTGNKLSLNIPPPPAQPATTEQLTVPTATATPQQQPVPYNFQSISPPVAAQKQASPTKKNFSCWFNLDSTPDPKLQEKQKHVSTPGMVQRVEDAVQNSKNSKVCPSCKGCNGQIVSELPISPKSVPEVTQKLALLDMVASQDQCRRSPVENTEWGTDDPDINCYM